MASIDTPRRGSERAAGSSLTTGTLVAAAFAVFAGQLAVAIPAVLNGLFQLDLGTSSSQLTWLSDAFLVPITLLELTFGVLGDLFGRKRLLVIGAGLLAVGEAVVVLTPGSGSSTDTRVLVFWVGQIIAGIGAAAMFPSSLAMIAAGTHTPRARARAISIWAAALATGAFVSPVVAGYVARYHWGKAPDASWHWAFVAVAVLGAVSLLITAALATESSAPEGRSLDFPGQITIAVALFALLFAVIQGSTAGWRSAEVLTGFVLAVVFLVLFVLAERRSKAPLLRLDLFRNRGFAVASVATVFGMFADLGTAYTTSIRLSSIQGFTPLKTSIAFVLLNGMALVLLPVTSRLLERYDPRWVLAVGFALIAAGDLWAATQSAADLSIVPIIAPLLLVSVGFALALNAVTAVSVNAVSNNLAGMASGTTSLLRDFGFTLGPAVVGAVALSRAAAEIHHKVATNPALAQALAAFNASPAHAPAAQQATLRAAVGSVGSGPLGANAVPAYVPGSGNKVALNPLKSTAFHALDHAYSLGYVICGLAALVAALLVAVVFGAGQRSDPEPTG